MRIVAFFIATLWVGAPASADEGNLNCSLYFESSISRPADVRSLMARYRDSAARVCLERLGKVEKYHSVSSVWADRFGVCQYQQIERDISSSRPAADTLISAHPILSYMYLSASDCPRHESSNYIETMGVSGGLFSVLVQFWEDIESSKPRFDAALSRVMTDDLSKLTLGSLQELLFVQGVRPRLLRITHIPAERGVLHAGYELELQTADPSEFITLYVDITPDGPKVLSIGLVVV
jgi:hypothetical protein